MGELSQVAEALELLALLAGAAAAAGTAAATAAALAAALAASVTCNAFPVIVMLASNGNEISTSSSANFWKQHL